VKYTPAATGRLGMPGVLQGRWRLGCNLLRPSRVIRYWRDYVYA